MRNKYLDTLDDPDFEVDYHEIAREREEWYDRVVSCYEYNRQWMSHADAVSATQTRYGVTVRTLRNKCKEAGVWEN